MAFDVCRCAGRYDHRRRTTLRTANVDGQRATFRNHDEVAITNAGSEHIARRHSQEVVGAHMRVVRGGAVGDVGRAAMSREAGGHECRALDPDVTAMWDAGGNEQLGAAGRTDGPDGATVLVRGDQLAGVRSESRRCHREPALEGWRRAGDRHDPTLAVNGDDRAVLIAQPRNQESMIEPANGIEHDAVEAVDTGEIDEVAGMTLGIDPGDPDRRRGPDREDVVAREVAVR